MTSISCATSAHDSGAKALAVPTGRVETTYRRGVKFYDVSGSTAAEIRSAMIKNGPRGDNGRAIAYFAWTILLADTQKQNCLPLKLNVAGLMTLPRHSNPAQIAPPLVSPWQYLLERLAAHELEHQKILLAEVARLEASLSKVAYSSCHDLRQTAQDLIRISMRRSQASSDSFDLASKGGQRDGVRWP
jgi:predicted secreted Zn-dependent protease